MASWSGSAGLASSQSTIVRHWAASYRSQLSPSARTISTSSTSAASSRSSVPSSEMNSSAPNPNASTASSGGGSTQYGSPMRIVPPRPNAGRRSEIVPARPPPIQVAPMQAATSNPPGSGT